MVRKRSSRRCVLSMYAVMGGFIFFGWYDLSIVAKTFAPTGVGKARDIGFLRSSLHASLIRQKQRDHRISPFEVSAVHRSTQLGQQPGAVGRYGMMVRPSEKYIQY